MATIRKIIAGNYRNDVVHLVVMLWLFFFFNFVMFLSVLHLRFFMCFLFFFLFSKWYGGDGE